jgi:NTE family protein
MKLKSYLFFLSIIIYFNSHNSFAQKVGLVFSGGGARGLAHIGVIKALEENGIPIDYVTGASMGSLVAGMYAQGFTTDEMEKLVCSEEFYNWALGVIPQNKNYYFKKKDDNASWITLRFNKDSVFQTSLPTSLINSFPAYFSMMEYTAPAIAEAHYNFDSLMVPFRCVAADIEDKKQVIFRSGDLGEAILASSAFPFYFKPIVFEGKILFDGGLYNNFPADVLIKEFNPDFVIGVDAVGGGVNDTPPDEDDIISQIRSMFMTKTNYTINGKDGIIIQPKTGKVGLLDFDEAHREIKAGYDAAIAQMDNIKKKINRRVDTAQIGKKRRDFIKAEPHIIISDIRVEGVNEKQAFYIRKILMPSRDPIKIEDLRANYYKLIADDNIKSVFPKLVYNPATGYFELHIRVKREKDLKSQFGGDFSSRPINEAFLGFQYNFWGRKSLSLTANTYFGKLYESAQVKARLDIPSGVPYYFESNFTINTWDFYNSSTTFFEDIKPAYLITTDRKVALDLGLPLGNQQKLYGGISYFLNSDNYYQTSNFIHTDTADVTDFEGYSPEFVFERNTLNKKQYATAGSFVSLKARYVNGREHSIPGSTSVDTTQIYNNHHWYQVNLTLDNYYKQRGHLRMGIYAEGNFSTQDFFSNYTSTILNMPAFQPIPESKTYFLGQYRAPTYAAFGLKNIISTGVNIDIRLEAYIFQPSRVINENPDHTAGFASNLLTKRLYMGTAAFVYSTPLGPVSLSLNLYDQKTDYYSILFHFGYILFNKKALE